MKKELLSPAGNFESLKAAVHAGADAVYVGGIKFGARKFASNFNLEELFECVNYCHLYGVKLYVTVNTMIYQEEMEEVLEYVGYLARIYVDAVIVQDIGLIQEIRNLYPTLEVHASTQLHNYSVKNCQLLEKIGVKRVVLARELSLEEVNRLETSLEKEIFIHGAICISYSGQCLFSSMVMGRSGNRGECAGMCRLPYTLEGLDGEVFTAGKYLLSPKEFCTISEFTELMKSDVTCFKIEGRMKSPAYVYFVTKIYRTLMDKYNRGEEVKITSEEHEQLQVLYNRGFTEGHLFEKQDFNLMNIKSPNHIGVSVGTVVSFDSKKIKISLVKELHQGDGIRFVSNQKGMIVNFLYDEHGLLVREASRGDIVFVDNKVHLKSPCEVLKTSDYKLLETLHHYPFKKIPISMKFIGRVGKPLHLEVFDGEHEVVHELGMISMARTHPTTIEDIQSHLERLGETPYVLDDFDVDISENVFIPMRLLNELRRVCVLRLDECRMKCDEVKKAGEYVSAVASPTLKNVGMCCLVRTEEQLQEVLKYDAARIYITDWELYQKYEDTISNLYYRQDRIQKNPKKCNRTLVTELSNLCQENVVTDYYLNVANTSYLKFLETYHVSCATLSVELTKKQILDVVCHNSTSLQLEVLVYGRVELMVMKHCPLRMLVHNPKDGACHACCHSYYLVDRNKERYPIVPNHGITHLLHSRTKKFTDREVEALIVGGIDFIRIEFFDETSAQVQNTLEKYQQMLQNSKIYGKMSIEGKGEKYESKV